MKSYRHHHDGFSLFELLTALTIVSLVLVFSLPIFSDYYNKGDKLAAITTLLRLATMLEGYHLKNGGYHHATLKLFDLEKMTRRYEFKLTTTRHAYLLSATPLQKNNCGTLTLNEKGEKRVTGVESSEVCWGSLSLY